MPNINKCTIAGHAAADAEVRETKSGKLLCEIRMALVSGYKDSEKVNWVKVIIWGKPAEWMGGVEKGDMVMVEGAELSIDEWEGRDGDKRQTVVFSAGIGSSVFYVKKGHFKSQMQRNDRPETNVEHAGGPESDDENLPF